MLNILDHELSCVCYFRLFNVRFATKESPLQNRFNFTMVGVKCCVKSNSVQHMLGGHGYSLYHCS